MLFCLLLRLFCYKLLLAQERVSFEDKELAAVTDILQLDLVASEALAQTVSLVRHELDFALEYALQVEDKVTAGVVNKDVLVVDKGDEVVVVLTSLRKQIDEAKISQRHHYDAIALKVGVVFLSVVAVLDIRIFIIFDTTVFLHIPDKSAFLRISGTRYMQMIVKHDLSRLPCGVVHAL